MTRWFPTFAEVDCARFPDLELLREEGSLAYQLLSSRLKDWELYQIRLRIEREMLAGQQSTTQSPEEFYRAFTEELRACSGAARSVSTAHALRAIVSAWIELV